MTIPKSVEFAPSEHQDGRPLRGPNRAEEPEPGWTESPRSRFATRVRNARERARLGVHRYGYPLRALVRRDFKARYAQTIVGMGWAVLQPLALLLLYTFVFAVILNLKLRPGATQGSFALYLACGMFPFLALAEGIQRATTSLTENRSLLDKVRFPAEVLPAVGLLRVNT